MNDPANHKHPKTQPGEVDRYLSTIAQRTYPRAIIFLDATTPPQWTLCKVDGSREVLGFRFGDVRKHLKDLARQP